MKYENLNIELIKRFPELADAAKKVFAWMQGEKPGPHIFYGDFLNPLLIEELSTLNNPEFIDKIFEFLEEMALSDDVEIQNVVIVTVLEQLGDDKNILNRARTFMRGRTTQFSHEIEKLWGRE
ncbi:MAG: hypothetical protein HN929_13345 [Chloroflexi bacterium]|jgi:hypothetical protein|nr:hypothetical protein [Chloroflexota bacterium]MBT7082424.1 hypothetical protein [Chloroflexota bacterium]MBT7290374.1 hypothetical protein [Chloroflexota bacterium]